jgi:hypothetical protein
MTVKPTTADEVLFRASANGDIMTNDRSGKAMGDTCKKRLRNLYRELMYDRRKIVNTKQTEKGLRSEEDAITLYSRVKKTMFKKNDRHLKNRFVMGTPDIFIGDTIEKAVEGFDTKCSWDLWTFPHAGDKLDPAYYWQNQTYMMLTGAKKWTTVYCLVNAPADLIKQEKKSLFFKMGCPEMSENPDANITYNRYIDECIEIEKNMIFDMTQFRRDNPHFDLDCKVWEYDIPIEERVIEFETVLSMPDIDKLIARIGECRQYMNENFFKK